MAQKFKKPMIISGIVLAICIIVMIIFTVFSVMSDVLFIAISTISAISFTVFIISAMFYAVFSFVVKTETTNVAFKAVKYTGQVTLENNFDGVINNPKWDDVNGYINIMLDNDEEFVTITLIEAIYGIRYMQTSKISGGITVQLGLEENNTTRLVEKICDKEQLIEYMNDFYQFGYVNDVASFKPVKFMV